MMCPDRGMKQQATDILRSMKGRLECVWDSQTVAETGEKAIALMDEKEKTRDAHRLKSQNLAVAMP